MFVLKISHLVSKRDKKKNPLEFFIFNQNKSGLFMSYKNLIHKKKIFWIIIFYLFDIHEKTLV